MREAIHRFNHWLFAWIPDISGAPPRRQATVGVIASVVVHLLLILGFVIFGGALQKNEVGFAKNKPQLKEIELVVLPPPVPKVEEPPPVLPLAVAKPQHEFLDSRGLDEAKEAADIPLFESDKNMRAASELPASGDAPLPSQEGSTDRLGIAFKTQQDTLGLSTPLQPIPEVQKQTPAPLYKPQPIPKESIDPKTKEPVKDVQQPAPAATPEPKPIEVKDLNQLAQNAMQQIKDVTKPKDDEIPLNAKPMVTPPPAITRIQPPLDRPHPVPIQPAPAQATPRPETMAMLTTPPPKPQPVPNPGYQPQLEKTKIKGNITNRGKAAVDAMATPLARYRKQVNDAIGSRWYYYIHQRMDLIAAGSVTISFSIDDKGHVVDAKIDSNSSNTSFASVCERAVREAEIAPPPPDIVEPMKDGLIEYSLTFTFYNL